MAEDGTLRSATHTGVPDHDPRGRDCRVREVLDRVADKWSLLVMALLAGGPRRYSELRRGIDGISQRMLTLTLRNLVRDGLVDRTVTPTTPPRVDYALTEMGRGLSTEVSALVRWADGHLDQITAARERYDAEQARPQP